jgi:hypothetical protein
MQKGIGNVIYSVYIANCPLSIVIPSEIIYRCPAWVRSGWKVEEEWTHSGGSCQLACLWYGVAMLQRSPIPGIGWLILLPPDKPDLRFSSKLSHGA